MSQRQWRKKGRELKLKKIRIKCDSGGGISDKVRKNVYWGLLKKRNVKLAYLAY